jgi:hypothetical protein
LVAALPRILKYKGTLAAVEMAGNALIAASGASGIFDIDEDKLSEGVLSVTLPLELVDSSLFTDLLEYILPAGMTYKVTRAQVGAIEPINKYKLSSDNTLAAMIPEITWEADTELEGLEKLTGLASMYEVGRYNPVFTNFITGDNDSSILNTGLLNNTIIPALTRTIAYDAGYTETSNNYGTTIIIDNYTEETNGDETIIRTEGDL